MHRATLYFTILSQDNLMLSAQFTDATSWLLFKWKSLTPALSELGVSLIQGQAGLHSQTLSQKRKK